MSADQPRCAVIVSRVDMSTGWYEDDPLVYRPEPCGRPATSTVRVGNRDVPTCRTHYIRPLWGLLVGERRLSDGCPAAGVAGGHGEAGEGTQ